MLPSAGPGSENAAANAAVVVIALETDRSICDVKGVAGGKSGSVASATVAGSEIRNVAIVLLLL